jgi:hypothetical protein
MTAQGHASMMQTVMVFVTSLKSRDVPLHLPVTTMLLRRITMALALLLRVDTIARARAYLTSTMTAFVRTTKFAVARM